MASTGKLKRISPADLDRLLDQARTERWPELVLLEPGMQLSDRVEYWPEPLKLAGRIFHLRESLEGPVLVSKLQSLTSLNSLNLWGNSIGADGAKVIAASLTGLTSLDLGHNSIGAEGATAIAASLTGLTSLNLG